jgi:hypothetical protein
MLGYILEVPKNLEALLVYFGISMSEIKVFKKIRGLVSLFLIERRQTKTKVDYAIRGALCIILSGACLTRTPAGLLVCQVLQVSSTDHSTA